MTANMRLLNDSGFQKASHKKHIRLITWLYEDFHLLKTKRYGSAITGFLTAGDS